MSSREYVPDYQKMSVARLTAEYETRLKEELNRAISRIPDFVDSLVKDAVAKIVAKKLGLEYFHGRWDLSYPHKDGEFVRLVVDSANQYVRDNAEKLTKTYLSKLTKEDTEEIKETYKATLSVSIERLMDDRAAVESKAIVAKLLGKQKEEEA